MNEKLKNILTVLYNQPSRLHEVCIENLVNKNIKGERPHSTFDTLAVLSAENEIDMKLFIYLIKNQYITNSSKRNSEIINQIEEMQENFKTAPSRDTLLSEIKKHAKWLDDTLKDNSLKADYLSYLEKSFNEGTFEDYYSATLAPMLISLMQCENHEKYQKIEEFTTKLLISYKKADIVKNQPENVNELRDRALEVIGKIKGEFKEDIETILNSYSIFSDFAKITNNPKYVRFKAKCGKVEDVQIMKYYKDCKLKHLITNEEELDVSITKAINESGLGEKSKYIKYALTKIEERIREKHDLLDTVAVVASQVAFLTLCDNLNTELDDNVLFAFLNPLTEFEHTIDKKSFKNALDIAKETVNSILKEMDENSEIESVTTEPYVPLTDIEREQPLSLGSTSAFAVRNITNDGVISLKEDPIPSDEQNEEILENSEIVAEETAKLKEETAKLKEEIAKLKVEKEKLKVEKEKLEVEKEKLEEETALVDTPTTDPAPLASTTPKSTLTSTLNKQTSIVKSFTKIKFAKIYSNAMNELSNHGYFLGVTGKGDYKKADTTQKGIHSEVLNCLSSSKTLNKIKNIIEKGKNDGKPFISKPNNTFSNEFLVKYIDVLKELYDIFKKQEEKLQELKTKAENKTINFDVYEKALKEYKEMTKISSLKKILKCRINNKIYRQISSFGKEYADEYEK